MSARRAPPRSQAFRLHRCAVDPGLLRLMEDLVESLDERDSVGRPAAPADAVRRVQRLEAELARRLSVGLAGSDATDARDEELVAIS